STDEPAAVREGVDGELAVVAAALALNIGHLLAEIPELLQIKQGTDLTGSGLLPAVQGSAVGAHQTSNVGADDLHPHLLLKGTEDCFVVEGTSLDHNVPAQLLGAGSPDDLVQGVFHHADGKAGGHVLNGSAVLLGLLDAAVHENGAAAAQVHGAVCKQTQCGKFFHIVAQSLGKGLQKAAAAGGTGFIEEDVADGSILNFEALHVLAADVDDEIHIGHKIPGGGKVGNGLHQTVVTVEGVLDQLFSVAGGGDTGDL